MREQYENPLCRRYASREMQEIFSDARKFSTWRKLWIALAESEQEMGLNITDEQIAEMRAHVNDIDFAVADAREREVRHDVMAYLRLRSGLPDRKADYPPWRNQLLCRRQYRSDSPAGRASAHSRATASHHCRTGGFCRALQGSANVGVYPFSGGTADHGRKARNALVAGSDDGS